jgi:hypothetical protein
MRNRHNYHFVVHALEIDAQMMTQAISGYEKKMSSISINHYNILVSISLNQ